MTTSNPFAAAARVVRQIESLKPITRRPAWESAQALHERMQREVAELRLPDDDFAEQPAEAATA